MKNLLNKEIIMFKIILPIYIKMEMELIKIWTKQFIGIKNLPNKEINMLNIILQLYKNGFGIDKDVNKAIYWYQKSAEQENHYAQNSLANIYQNEIEIDKDIEIGRAHV